MSAPAYLIAVLATDAAWADEVIERCGAEICGIVERPEMVAVRRELPRTVDPAEAPPQVLALFLADAGSRDDAGLIDQVERAREQFVVVLPVHHSGADVFEVLPDVLRPLNAIEWEPGGAQVTLTAARLSGLRSLTVGYSFRTAGSRPAA